MEKKKPTNQMRLSEFVGELKTTGRKYDPDRDSESREKVSAYLKSLRGARNTEQNNAAESAETWLESIERAIKVTISKRGMNAVKNADFERSVKQAAQWAFSRPTKWVMFCGTIGNGKTTLAASLAQAIGENSGGPMARRISAVSLNRATGDDIDSLIAEPLLLIDDLGCEQTDIRQYGNTVSPIAEILSGRYDNMNTTIITTNEPPQRLQELYGDRIADRLREMVTVIVMKGPSYRAARKGGER